MTVCWTRDAFYGENISISLHLPPPKTHFNADCKHPLPADIPSVVSQGNFSYSANHRFNYKTGKLQNYNWIQPLANREEFHYLAFSTN